MTTAETEKLITDLRRGYEMHLMQHEHQTLHRRAADALAAQQGRMEEWVSVKLKHPAPHAKYLIRRNGVVYTATPCYGMHSPWWVVKTLRGEAEPENFHETDEWQPIPAAQLAQESEQKEKP